MLSVQTVSAKMAQSYYDKDNSIERNQNYYTRDMKAGDTWQGNYCKHFGAVEGKAIETARFDAALEVSGEKVSGIDLTFSAPKSVSVCANCGEAVLEQDMRQAHRQAVAETLREIEQNEIGTRVRGINGNPNQTFVRTGKMCAAKFEHNTSRALDPQLHTHTVILNKTEYHGQEYTLDGKRLYNCQKVYGAEYRARLAENLQEKGYKIEITNAEKGEWELAGMTPETLQHFSQRRAAIIAEMEQTGKTGAKAAQSANLKTRSAKQPADIEELRGKWRTDLRELQQELPKPEAQAARNITAEQQVAYSSAVRSLEDKEFAWTQKQFEEAICNHGVGCGITKQRAIELINADEKILSGKLKTGPTVQNENATYYTTARNIANEQKIFASVERGKGTFKAISQEQTTQTMQRVCAEKGWSLKPQQAELVQHICTSQDRIIGVQGLAGTGKTFSLNATREVLEANGYEVRGMAPSGAAAQELAADAGLEGQTSNGVTRCCTMHKALNEAEKAAGNAQKGEDYTTKRDWNFEGLNAQEKPVVYFVDEASLADNNTLKNVLDMTERQGAKVVLVGDDSQLQPVGTGKAFTELVQQNKISYCRLDDIQRQKDPELLKAVQEAVKGDAGKSLDLISKEITEIATPKKRLAAVTKDYCSLSAEEQQKTIVITAKNADRRELNERIRAQLVKDKKLEQGKEYTVQASKDGGVEQRFFAKGDKVIFLKNDLKVGVMNSTKGIIQDINGNKFTVDIGQEKPVVVDISQYKNIEHGYCISTHKSQGMTVDNAIIHMNSADKSLNARNSYYVNVSRAKLNARMYVDSKAKIAPQVQKWAQKYSSKDFNFNPKTGKFSTPFSKIGSTKSAGKSTGKAVGKGVQVATKASATAIKFTAKALRAVSSIVGLIPIVGTLAKVAGGVVATGVEATGKAVEASGKAGKSAVERATESLSEFGKGIGQMAAQTGKTVGDFGKSMIQQAGGAGKEQKETEDEATPD